MGRRNQSREKLIEAFIELTWLNSYGSITVNAICDHVNVKKGSFYHSFESKEDLAIVAFEKLWMEEYKPKMDEQFSPTKPPLKRLSDWIEEGLKEFQELYDKEQRVVGCPFFNLGMELATTQPMVRDKIVEVMNYFMSYLSSSLREAVANGEIQLDSVDDTADAIFSMVEGAISFSRITNDPKKVQHLPKMINQMLGVTN